MPRRQTTKETNDKKRATKERYGRDEGAFNDPSRWAGGREPGQIEPYTNREPFQPYEPRSAPREPWGPRQTWDPWGSGPYEEGTLGSSRAFSHDEGFGPHRGKGPKGYKRSDERIREDICDRLSRGHVDASEVEVAVQNGEVTFTGSVPDRRMKHTIEDIADQVLGVEEIHNHIRVRKEKS